MAKLLIIDDDADLVETLRDVFEMQEHQVETVDSGADALKRLSETVFDLILLDWQLPDMTGVEVCKQYRAAGGRDRILMLTGMRDSSSHAESKAAGVDDVLTKPFNVQQLLKSVQSNLSQVRPL